MRNRSLLGSLVLLLGASAASAEPKVHIWTSSEDGAKTLTAEAPLIVSKPDNAAPTFVIDEAKTFQTMLGLGSSLEPTTCYNLSLLPEADREATLEKLVNPYSGIGMNLMRVCIGTPDFTRDPWYTYDDVPKGETDPELARFSIEKDRAYILPILKLALEKNPNLLFYASPWSPPGWMTSTGDMIGGVLLPEWYEAYANYFVRFVQAYAAEGIPIHAVTIQNEPGVDRSIEDDPKWHYPSCKWTGETERDFVRDHLGPAFKRHGIATEIWTYDHNFNTEPTPDGDDPGIDYPRTVLSDSTAAEFVSGVAFHGYAGEPSGMSLFAKEFPDVPLYFTEGSTYGVRGAFRIMDLLRNGASSYNVWVTMIDENAGPNNGPFEASRTCITLDSKPAKVETHFDFYMYGQFMKSIQRGARRIACEGKTDDLGAIAFANPDGAVVVVVANRADSDREVLLDRGSERVRFSTPKKSVATLRWTE